LEKGTFTYVSLGLLVWAISGTLLAGYYLARYNMYQKEYNNLVDTLESVSLSASILISYGNDTKTWKNATILPLNSTAFTAISEIADTEYQDYGGELGVLVTSVNGLAGNTTHGWLYWHWDGEKSVWVMPEYSSARFLLHRDDVIAFTYVSYVTWPPPQPT